MGLFFTLRDAARGVLYGESVGVAFLKVCRRLLPTANDADFGRILSFAYGDSTLNTSGNGSFFRTIFFLLYTNAFCGF